MGYQDTFQRVETKYLLNKQQRQRLLWAVSPYMELDAYGRTLISNIYYDTPDYALIRRSLEKPVYKEKLRLRSYGVAAEDSTVFIELKKKYKGIVFKRRTGAKELEAMAYLNRGRPLQERSQITEEIDYFKKFYGELNPVMVISYEREAFFCKDYPDLRITFDDTILWREEELSLRERAYGEPLLQEGQTLLEIKSAFAIPMWLTSNLSEQGIFPTSFSKYGNAYLQKMQRFRAMQSERKQFACTKIDIGQERKAQ